MWETRGLLLSAGPLFVVGDSAASTQSLSSLGDPDLPHSMLAAHLTSLTLPFDVL